MRCPSSHTGAVDKAISAPAPHTHAAVSPQLLRELLPSQHGASLLRTPAPSRALETPASPPPYRDASAPNPVPAPAHTTTSRPMEASILRQAIAAIVLEEMASPQPSRSSRCPARLPPSRFPRPPRPPVPARPAEIRFAIPGDRKSCHPRGAKLRRLSPTR